MSCGKNDHQYFLLESWACNKFDKSTFSNCCLFFLTFSMRHIDHKNTIFMEGPIVVHNKPNGNWYYTYHNKGLDLNHN